ncbi:TraQ conjugal transfer family protein [Larkinella insperata]|uniref:TraQ conjugal transfer family protein n=1 Tax=Larkinella insperata TaxID=332158 RepID=A0ABW3QN57_9BACT
MKKRSNIKILLAGLQSVVILLAVAGCQKESLDIQGPYRIKLSAAPVSAVLKVGEQTKVYMNLQTDSYYSETGYRLVFYQQTGLGRLSTMDSVAVPQKVPVPLALGRSSCFFTPAAVGNNQIVLVAQQERGFTQSDTVRLTFNVIP